MRKWLWGACLAGVVGGVNLFGTAWYVYKNPDSFLGRCAAMTFVLTTQYNPLVFVCQSAAADIVALTTKDDDAIAEKELEDFERPDEPMVVEDAVAPEPLGPLHGIIDMPMPHLPLDGAAIDRVGDTQEPPLAEHHDCKDSPMCPIVDPAVRQASGVIEVMPPCDDDEEMSECNGMCGWFWKMVENCCKKSEAMSGWFWPYLSSPTVLEYKGDEETSEPMDMNPPNDCKEDPYLPYHHSGCPYSGACPYTGKMPSNDPPMEPVKPSKKLKKMPKPDDMEESETTPKHPEIDTMEFRPSDRSWGDYGNNFDL